MPLATPGQYAQMLAAAAERRYAYAAVNVTSSETLNAALRGFQLADADGIIQITVRCRRVHVRDRCERRAARRARGTPTW